MALAVALKTPLQALILSSISLQRSMAVKMIRIPDKQALHKYDIFSLRKSDVKTTSCLCMYTCLQVFKEVLLWWNAES